MNILDKKIIEFIKEHHVLTLATSNNNIPYCANCFYVFSEKEIMLVFVSDRDTKHINDVAINSNVAGSIVLETSKVFKIQGIQFNGEMFELKDELLSIGKKAYLKKFPYAIIKETIFWGISLNFIKLTDNRLGFGKKLIWEKAL